MKISERFVAHNADSPVVAAEWLMADKKPARGHPSTWKWHRARLDDGTVYDIHVDEWQPLMDSGWRPRWKGID